MAAQAYRKLFEELVKKDLAVYEERRLQDMLLCRAQAPSFSVKDEDFHTLWEQRLTELLDKRKLYLQVSSATLPTPDLQISETHLDWITQEGGDLTLAVLRSN